VGVHVTGCAVCLCVQSDGSKIALSMKVVNQTTGKDLDPANVQTTYDIFSYTCGSLLMCCVECL